MTLSVDCVEPVLRITVYRSIEAAASHEAKRVEQAAQGELDRQKLQNEIEAEKERAKVQGVI